MNVGTTKTNKWNDWKERREETTGQEASKRVAELDILEPQRRGRCRIS